MMAKKISLLVLVSFCVFSVNSYSQSVTGIWKGYFVSDNGETYKLEFQVKESESYSVTGVSYSYLDVRFYGKATMTGSFVKNSKKFRIKEIRTVEIKSVTGGGACIMNYDLEYSRSGKEEYLQGTFLGKTEVKGSENPYEWGQCGGGTVFLRRVQSSDFYVEPFLRKKEGTTAIKKDTTNKKANPPIVRKSTTTTPKTNTKTTNTNTQKNTATTRPKTDTIVKTDAPVVKTVPKPAVPRPAVLKERQNELMKSLVVHDQDVTIKLYDNGEIDDDTISVFYDNKLLVSNKRLNASPITIKLKIEDENTPHELIMVAENLGRIPPNTSLMIVESGDQRFDVRITSTEQKNALVRFRYERPN